MATKHQVIRLHRAYPQATDREIAVALGCDVDYVRATARRNGLVLAWTVSIAMRHERCRQLAEAIDYFLNLDETLSAEQFVDARRRVIRALALCPDPEARHG